jgi:hypothetical protein
MAGNQRDLDGISITTRGNKMKERNGFVSNSSSSSFICVVCGEIESGMDAGPYDFDMVECTNSHYIHRKCLGEKLTKSADSMLFTDEFDVWFEDNKDDFSPAEMGKYSKLYHDFKNTPREKRETINIGNGVAITTSGEMRLSEGMCPVCSFKSLNDPSILKYLVLSGAIDMKKVSSDLYATFKNYEQLYKWVREHEKQNRICV